MDWSVVRDVALVVLVLCSGAQAGMLAWVYRQWRYYEPLLAGLEESYYAQQLGRVPLEPAQQAYSSDERWQ